MSEQFKREKNWEQLEASPPVSEWHDYVSLDPDAWPEKKDDFLYWGISY